MNINPYQPPSAELLVASPSPVTKDPVVARRIRLVGVFLLVQASAQLFVFSARTLSLELAVPAVMALGATVGGVQLVRLRAARVLATVILGLHVLSAATMLLVTPIAGVHRLAWLGTASAELVMIAVLWTRGARRLFDGEAAPEQPRKTTVDKGIELALVAAILLQAFNIIASLDRLLDQG